MVVTFNNYYIVDNVCYIEITNKYKKVSGFCIVDTEDLPKIMSRGRLSFKDYKGRYVYSSKGYVHRTIMNNPSSDIDHINNLPWDNRKSNLRIVDRTNNLLNQKIPIHNSSGCKNVQWHPAKKKWVVRFNIRGHPYVFGQYNNTKEASIRAEVIKRRVFDLGADKIIELKKLKAI